MVRVWIFFVCVLTLAISPVPAQTADLILYNGKIVTVDEKAPVVEAVAIQGGRFLALGKTDEILRLADPATMKLDLKGKTVTPGQVHTHTHVHATAEAQYGGEIGPKKLKMYTINFRAVRTKEDIANQIKSAIEAYQIPAGEWIYFSVTNIQGPQLRLLWDGITRWDLDKGSPNNPIVVSVGVPANSGYLTNSKGIEVLWAKYGDFIEKYGRYWVDAEGRPDGHLESPAGRLAYPLVPGPSPEDGAEIYKKVLEEYASQGVTTLATRLPDYAIKIYKRLDETGQLPVRFAYGIQDVFDTPDPSALTKIKIGEGTENFWVNSVSAGMVDGQGYSLCTDLKRNDQAIKGADENYRALGWDARSPFAEYYDRGWCLLDIEYRGGPKNKGGPIKGNYFADWYALVANNGLRAANTHVSGDGSHSRFISILEKIDAAKPGSVRGWGMDHCRMINPRDIPRAAKLGIIFSCSVVLDDEEEIAQVFNEQVAQTFRAPLKSMLDAGIKMGLEGEGVYRWEAIEQMITRKDQKGKVWGAHERLDRNTALRISTLGGAHYLLREKDIGSIEKGKLADLVVIDRDYMTIPEEEISEIKAIATVRGGKFTFIDPAFAQEYNFRPEGALIMTREQVLARRKPAGSGSGRS